MIETFTLSFKSSPPPLDRKQVVVVVGVSSGTSAHCHKMLIDLTGKRNLLLKAGNIDLENINTRDASRRKILETVRSASLAWHELISEWRNRYGKNPLQSERGLSLGAESRRSKRPLS